MEERLRIKEVLNQYVEALESDESALKSLLTENCILDSTNYGKAEGREAVIEKLRWRGCPLNVSKYKIFNFVAFTKGTEAVSSCVISALVGQEDSDYFHWFQFSGYCLNDYVLEQGEWKISKIRFQLNMLNGNTLFVRHVWGLLDYRYYQGVYEGYPICSEIQNPWIRFDEPDSLGSEKEQVLDAMFRYAWGIDHADFEVYKSCMDESADLSAMGIHNLRENINFMKFKRFKESNMEHIYKINRVAIDGDKAHVELYRYEPHRLGTQKLHKYNKNYDFYSMEGHYDFVKRPGKYPQGGWKMTKNQVVNTKVFYEISNDGKF